MNNLPVCVDASLVVRLIESGTCEAPVVMLWEEWHEMGHSVVAPTLLYYEVTNAMSVCRPRGVTPGGSRRRPVPQRAAVAGAVAVGWWDTLHRSGWQ